MKTQISLMHVVRYHKVYCKLLNLQKIMQNQRSKEFVQNTPGLDKIIPKNI